MTAPDRRSTFGEDRLPNEPSRAPWQGSLVAFGLIFAFWTFLAILTVASRVQHPRFGGADLPELLRTAVTVFHEYYFWALLTPVVFWFSRRLYIERSNWLSRTLMHVGIGFGMAIAVELITFWFRSTVLADFRGPGPQPSPYDIVVRLWFLDELIIYMAVLSAGFARDYFLRYQARQEETTRLRAEAARLEAELAEARLQALRMQVNPHFLFNTLHAVSTLVERDPGGVRRMIARLSDLLRYTLERSTDQEVPLRQELLFIDGYLEIQRIRFQGHLDVVESIDPDVMDALVPSLILQPLVENAVKHGVAKAEGAGRIELSARREHDRLVLSVTDNGPGFSGDALPGEERGLGVKNTRARLEGLYGTAQQLAFSSGPDGGVTASIVLPFHTGADLRTAAVLPD